MRPYTAVIRVYDAAGNVIDTHEHKGDFKEWRALFVKQKAAEVFRLLRTPFR
jgi:hypothetical protein